MTRKLILDSSVATDNSWTGLAIAITIILLWLTSLVVLFTIDIGSLPLILVVLLILLRSFLQTGLFITTHEAIHQIISPSRQINDFLGNVTSFLYALLPYKILSENHRLHHRYPATEEDPDFYEPDPHSYWKWYFNFMREYQKGHQAWVLLIGMTIVFWTFIGINISLLNIIFFWLVPILLSSLQLFTFGVFLPHRKPSSGYTKPHHAQSSDYSLFWSFVACYHFGYHWEHHQHPNVPWYRLPLARYSHQFKVD